MRARHQEGWKGTLDRLDRLLALPEWTREEDQTSKTKNRVLTPIELLADVSRSFWMRGTVGLEPNEERIKEHLENSLMLVTAFQSARGPREDDNDLPDSIPATSQPTRGFSQTRFRHGRAV